MAKKNEIYKIYHLNLKERTFKVGETEKDEYYFCDVFLSAITDCDPFSDYGTFYYTLVDMFNISDYNEYYSNTIVNKIFSFLPGAYSYESKYNRVIQDMMILVFLLAYIKKFERQPKYKEMNCIAGNNCGFSGNICTFNGRLKEFINNNPEDYKDDYAKYGIKYNDLKNDNLCALNNENNIYNYCPSDFNAWIEYFITKYNLGMYFTYEEYEVNETYNMNGYECRFVIEPYIKNNYQFSLCNDPTENENNYCTGLGLGGLTGSEPIYNKKINNKYDLLKLAFNKDGGNLYTNYLDDLFIYPTYQNAAVFSDTELLKKYRYQFAKFIWALVARELHRAVVNDSYIAICGECYHPGNISLGSTYNDDIVPDNYWFILRDDVFKRFDKHMFPNKNENLDSNTIIEPTEGQLLLNSEDYISEASDKLERKFDELLENDLKNAKKDGDSQCNYVKKTCVYDDEKSITNNCYGYFVGSETIKDLSYYGYSSYQTYNAIPPLSGQHGMLCNWNKTFRPIDTLIYNGQGYERNTKDKDGNSYPQASSYALMYGGSYTSTNSFYDYYNTVNSTTQETAFCSGKGHLDMTYVSRAMPKYFKNFNSLTITLPSNFKSFTEGYIRCQVYTTVHGFNSNGLLKAFYNDKLVYQKIYYNTYNVSYGPSYTDFNIYFDFYMEAPIKNTDTIKLTFNGVDLQVDGRVFVEFCQQKP